MAQITTAARQAKGTYLEGRVPDAPQLELAMLGAALLDWPQVGLLDPDLFHYPAHRRLAEAINRAAALGGVTDELVLSLLDDDDAGLVTDAHAVAALGAAIGATRHRLAELAGERFRLFEAQALVRANGKPRSVLGVEVVSAYLDGQCHYTLKVGTDTHEVTAAELREGTAWDHFPEAKGVGSRRQRDELNQIVRDLGAKVMTRPQTLPGYGQLAEGASREGWAAICDEILTNPPGMAFYAGAGLGSYFLTEAGRQHELRPLGFALHAVGAPRSGKTTAELVVAAQVGNPELAPEGLLHSWGGSAKGLEVLAAEVGRYPLVRSDTSTWERSGRELAGAVMQLFEGPRDLSSRRGERLSVGRAYKGILCSSGNEGICHYVSKDRGAILARVLELPGPLTSSREHAHRLAALAAEHYGWPVAQVEAGKFTGERFRELVNEAARVLNELAPLEAPVAMDVAVRCAIVIAGAGALGELVDEARGEAMFNAALTAALELLEGLEGTLEDDHRPVGLALLAGLWERYERRPERFPVIDREGDSTHNPLVDSDGFLRDVDGAEQLAVLRKTATDVAAELGVADINQAWAELRELGLLVPRTGRPRFQNLIARRDGGRVRSIPVYIVRRPPEEDCRAPLEPPCLPPRWRAPCEPLSPDGAFAEGPRATRATKNEGMVLKERGQTGGASGARPSAYFRAVSDGRLLWYRGAGGGTAVPGTLGGLAERVAELAGERSPVLWLTPQGRQRLGLPPRLAEAVAMCRDQGLRAEQRGDHVMRVDPRGVLVHATEYVDEFTELEGPALWRALERFSATTGLEYVYSPGTTVAAMLLLARRRARLTPAEAEPELTPAIAGSAWSVKAWAWEARRAKERPPGSVLSGFDENAAYLAAWRRCELPGGTWAEHGPFVLEVSERRAGYFRLELGDLMAELEARDLPPVFARKGRRREDGPTVWVTGPLATLAAELAAELELPPVRCQRAYLATERHRYLDSVAEQLTAAYVALKADGSPEAAAALGAIKGMYAEGTMQFEALARNRQGHPELWRPAWCYTVLDRHAANTFRDLRIAGAVGWSKIDHASFMGEPAGLRIGTAPGTWKHE